MRSKRLVLSIVSVALLFCLTFTAVYLPLPTFADSISDLKDKISELEDEQKEIEAEIAKLKADKKEQNKLKASLQARIDNLQSQINACNQQLKSYENEIKTLKEEVEKKNKEFEETKKQFYQRLRSIYMSGGNTTANLTMLLDSNGISELLTKSEMTKSVSEYDNALCQKITSEIKEIEEKQEKIKQLVKEQEEIKITLAAKKKELSGDMSDINDVISDINSDQKDLEKQIANLESAIKEYENDIKNAQNIGKDQVHSGQFTWPCPGHYNITSPYGYRWHPISHKWKMHSGIDIAGGNIKGKPIVAAADGIVSIAKYNSGGYGYYVMVNHGTGSDDKEYSTLYAHMTRYIVSVGQSVKKGQTIGYVGTSGASTGYHLHFEIRIDGNTTNPMNYF